MNKDEIKIFIQNVLEEISDKDTVDEDTLLLEEEILDSLSILYLIEEIEKKYSIQIALEDVVEKNFNSIISIVEFISKLVDLGAD